MRFGRIGFLLASIILAAAMSAAAQAGLRRLLKTVIHRLQGTEF